MGLNWMLLNKVKLGEEHLWNVLIEGGLQVEEGEQEEKAWQGRWQNADTTHGKQLWNLRLCVAEPSCKKPWNHACVFLSTAVGDEGSEVVEDTCVPSFLN